MEKMKEAVQREENVTGIKKYSVIFIAVNLIGIAVALFLKSGLGCDTIGLLCDGLSRLLGVSFGVASLLYNVLLIGTALLAARKELGAGTMVYGLLSGFFIDFYQWVLELLHFENLRPGYGVLAFLVGEICMSAAFAILMRLHLGMTALDALLVKLQGILHIPYTYLKMGVDVLFVIAGTLWGGTFGAGTIVSALVTGMLVTGIAKYIDKIVSVAKMRRNPCIIK